MHVGSQIHYTQENMIFLRQMGVEYVDVGPQDDLGLKANGYWDADKLTDFRKHVESFGLKLAAMHLPLTSAGIERQVWPNILMGTPDRDRDIQAVCKRSRRPPRQG